MTAVGETREDSDDHETSNRRVPGFRDGFKNPNLWPGQNGKVLNFSGKWE